MVQKCQYLAKNANILPNMPNLSVFGPKILIFTGVSKSFFTLIMENHLGTLIALFFGHGMKWANKTNIWPLAFEFSLYLSVHFCVATSPTH